MAGGKKSEPIVVAQIMGKWVGGGVEAVIMNYYRHIDRTKVQLDFICDEDSTNIPYEEIEKLGGHVILCPPYQKLFKYMKFLENLFREKKYRIVHSNINTLSVFPLRAAKKAGVPVRIAHSHSASNKKEILRNIIKHILRTFSRRYATDYYACSIVAGKFQFGKKATNRGEVVLITNAIDLERYSFDGKARREIRKELGYSENDYVIGAVGRLETTKNYEFLIKTFADYRGGNKQIKLLIIGEGKLRKKLETIILRRKLKDAVRIENYRVDINKCYSAMDLFVLPSLYEGLGLVAIEAQASGLHVIASDKVPIDADMGNMERRKLNKMFLNGAGLANASRYNINSEAICLQDRYMRFINE